jgi:hypothetical protein
MPVDIHQVASIKKDGKQTGKNVAKANSTCRSDSNVGAPIL